RSSFPSLGKALGGMKSLSVSPGRIPVSSMCLTTFSRGTAIRVAHHRAGGTGSCAEQDQLPQSPRDGAILPALCAEITNVAALFIPQDLIRRGFVGWLTVTVTVSHTWWLPSKACSARTYVPALETVTVVAAAKRSAKATSPGPETLSHHVQPAVTLVAGWA